jgi:FkbM family methyltransferase
MILRSIHRQIVKGILRIWPLERGIHRIYRCLGAPPAPEGIVTTRMRRSPLIVSCMGNSVIGRYMYYRGTFEPSLLSKLKEVLRPGMCFLDIGSNVGIHSLHAARLVGPGGKVLAVEPQSKACALLEKNISRNAAANIQVARCALGPMDETRTFYHISKDDLGMNSLRLRGDETPLGSEVVEVRTLETLAESHRFQHVDVAKIDVEGAEMEVLRGCDSFFRARGFPSHLFIEVIDYTLARFNSSSKEVVDYLLAAGYALYSHVDGAWRPFHWKADCKTDLLCVLERGAQ